MNDIMNVIEIRYGPGKETVHCQFSVTYITPPVYHLYINGKCIGSLTQNAAELMTLIRSSNLWARTVYRYY